MGDLVAPGGMPDRRSQNGPLCFGPPGFVSSKATLQSHCGLGLPGLMGAGPGRWRIFELFQETRLWYEPWDIT